MKSKSYLLRNQAKHNKNPISKGFNSLGDLVSAPNNQLIQYPQHIYPSPHDIEAITIDRIDERFLEELEFNIKKQLTPSAINIGDFMFDEFNKYACLFYKQETIGLKAGEYKRETVNRALKEFHRLGLINKKERVNNTCFYGLSNRVRFSGPVRKMLSKHFPSLAVLAFSLLFSTITSSHELEIINKQGTSQAETVIHSPKLRNIIIKSSSYINAVPHREALQEEKVVDFAAQCTDLMPEEYSFEANEDSLKVKDGRKISIKSVYSPMRRVSNVSKKGAVFVSDKEKDEQREKLQKTAMHKLVPTCIRYFTKIPLTVAGKIYLSRFPVHALEYAIARYNEKLSPKLAFKDLVFIAEAYCVRHHKEVNMDTPKLLNKLFVVSPEDVFLYAQGTKPGREAKLPIERVEIVEPVYISYFKLRDHLESKRFTFPNPFKGRYEEYLKEALESVDISREEIEEELYNLYLKQKEANDVRIKGETDSSSEAQVYDTLSATCV